MAGDLDRDMAVLQAKTEFLEAQLITAVDSYKSMTTKLDNKLERLFEKIEEFHGHIDRCKIEIRREMERDFMTATEGEKIRGDIKSFRMSMRVGFSIMTLIVALVQIGLTIWI